ncbi:hypothetical protein [Bifidobacterium sp. ESL0825]|uniref:hypothetical protein n=1 Tax=Bifidobacterium sp. ESL0825 TaxID=3448587 RepID=UPI0040431ED0
MITLPDGRIYFDYTDFEAEVGSGLAARTWALTERATDRWIDTKSGTGGKLASPMEIQADPHRVVFDADFLDEMVRIAREVQRG